MQFDDILRARKIKIENVHEIKNTYINAFACYLKCVLQVKITKDDFVTIKNKQKWDGIYFNPKHFHILL